jgi:hypothetical protein
MLSSSSSNLVFSTWKELGIRDMQSSDMDMHVPNNFGQQGKLLEKSQGIRGTTQCLIFNV